ncbi:hypothetical protein P4S84_04940, partial [Aneurinibacillus aneurinilyticus]|nr:hypothetical protein [Aneurinibacillus aneurinilyticus]
TDGTYMLCLPYRITSFLKGTLVLLYHDCDNIRLRLTEIHLPLSLVLSPSRLEVGDFFRREVKGINIISLLTREY